MFFTFQGFEVVTESENHDFVRDKHLKNMCRQAIMKNMNQMMTYFKLVITKSSQARPRRGGTLAFVNQSPKQLINSIPEPIM